MDSIQHELLMQLERDKMQHEIDIALMHGRGQALRVVAAPHPTWSTRETILEAAKVLDYMLLGKVPDEPHRF